MATASTKTTTTFEKETFVYDGIEIYKTGRVAEKQISNLKRKALEKRGLNADQMVEIKPLDQDMAPFKVKWVEEDKLFRVLQNPENSGEIELMER
jgi:hypothetical protein